MTDLFTTDDNATTIDPNKNYHAELVGEGKKYADDAALARSRVEADAFIERLKTENNGLRNELKTRSTLEEVLDKMNNPPSNSNASSSNNQQSESGETALKPEDIARLVDERVVQREQDRRATENLNSVKQLLAQAYGSDYAQKLHDEASSLGLSKEYVNNLAATAPKALFRLLGIDENTTQKTNNDLFTPPTSQVRNFPSSGNSSEKTMKHYEALRKSNPSQYWSPATQNQMHKDAQRLGERFFT
jgi:hypothetical protein